MIRLAFAIAGALLLLEFGGFVVGLLLAAFGRWKDERDVLRALRWWGSLTAEEQSRWQAGPVSQADILRAWDAHRLQL